MTFDEVIVFVVIAPYNSSPGIQRFKIPVALDDFFRLSLGQKKSGIAKAIVFFVYLKMEQYNGLRATKEGRAQGMTCR